MVILVFLIVVGALLGWMIGPHLRPGGFGLLKDMALGVALTSAAVFILAVLRELVGSSLGAVVVSALVGACVALLVSKRIRSGQNN